jgi:hypothetical protein
MLLSGRFRLPKVYHCTQSEPRVARKMCLSLVTASDSIKVRLAGSQLQKKHVEGLQSGLPERIIEQATALGISRSAMVRVYLATSMQRSMLLTSALHPELYTTRVTLDLKGTLDKDTILRAWQAVCHAHPRTRTVFIPVQSRGTYSPRLLIRSFTQCSIQPRRDCSERHVADSRRMDLHEAREGL